MLALVVVVDLRAGADPGRHRLPIRIPVRTWRRAYWRPPCWAGGRSRHGSARRSRAADQAPPERQLRRLPPLRRWPGRAAGPGADRAGSVSSSRRSSGSSGTSQMFSSSMGQYPIRLARAVMKMPLGLSAGSEPSSARNCACRKHRPGRHRAPKSRPARRAA